MNVNYFCSDQMEIARLHLFQLFSCAHICYLFTPGFRGYCHAHSENTIYFLCCGEMVLGSGCDRINDSNTAFRRVSVLPRCLGMVNRSTEHGDGGRNWEQEGTDGFKQTVGR